MFAVCYPTEVVDDIAFEVEGRYVTAGGAIDVDVGCGDAFGGAEGEALNDPAAETVINIVYAHRLVETSFAKADFLKYIKAYMNRLRVHIKKTNPGAVLLANVAGLALKLSTFITRHSTFGADRLADFMKAAEPFVKKLLKNFDEYRFYMGESMDAEACIAIGFYKDEAGQIPTFYFFKDGLSLQHPGFGKSLDHPVQVRT